jgi:hypothetical protein
MAANDLTDIRPDGGANNPTVSPQTLPTRGEKRIIPTPVAPSTLSAEAQQYLGNKPRIFKNTGRTALVQASDFAVAAALEPFVDYVLIRIPHRGVSTTGQMTNDTAVYRFLINPSTVQVNRNTIDAQALTRAGWQIGIWGEDSLQISLSGKTAGQYFAFGIADQWQPYTESYRNLQQLQVVFENNGYWFEGEQAGEGPLAADFARRRIKMHADIELIVGNFMWSGMFDSLSINQSADMPFLMDFSLTFIAWKERFRSGSPYKDTIHNDVQRGHAYDSWAATSTASQNEISSAILANAPVFPAVSAPLPVLQQPGTTPTPQPGQPNLPVSGAQQSATQSNTQCTVNGTIQSSEPSGPILNPAGWATFYNGGL